MQLNALSQTLCFGYSSRLVARSPGDRPYPTSPLIKLGEKLANIEDYLERIPHGVPNILDLEHLTVAGDVTFGANVTLKVSIPACLTSSIGTG